METLLHYITVNNSNNNITINGNHYDNLNNEQIKEVKTNVSYMEKLIEQFKKYLTNNFKQSFYDYDVHKMLFRINICSNIIDAVQFDPIKNNIKIFDKWFHIELKDGQIFNRNDIIEYFDSSIRHLKYDDIKNRGGDVPINYLAQDALFTSHLLNNLVDNIPKDLHDFYLQLNFKIIHNEIEINDGIITKFQSALEFCYYYKSIICHILHARKLFYSKVIKNVSQDVKIGYKDRHILINYKSNIYDISLIVQHNFLNYKIILVSVDGNICDLNEAIKDFLIKYNNNRE